MTEKELQDKCLSICGRAGVYCMHIPNESGDATRRSIGMRKGVPDLLLVSENVVFVELKRNEKLQASEAQREFICNLNSNGVPARLVGSERQFMSALRLANKQRESSKAGVSIMSRTLYGDCNTSELTRVHRYFTEKQEYYAPNELFSVKLFASQDKKFPWLCNIKERCFIATKPSIVTSKLLMAGWDVVFI